MPELKIARIETFLFDPGATENLLFCRVETERASTVGAKPMSTAGRRAGDRASAARS